MAVRHIVILVVLAAAAALVAVVAVSIPSPGLELQTGRVLDQPRAINPFELVDQHERPFTRNSLQGRWHLVFIGFTHCPDACPTTMAMLGAVETRLRTEGHELQTVFVSVDPERDTPDELARYVGFFGEEIIGATGSKQQLDRFCDDLGFAYIKVPDGRGGYTVDHSGALALIDPHARVAGYFLPPFDLDGLADDLALVFR